MTFAKRSRVLLRRVAPIAAVLIVAKAAIHEFGFEFIALSALVAGAIFIAGFLLSHVLSDYKEAERTLGEIRARKGKPDRKITCSEDELRKA